MLSHQLGPDVSSYVRALAQCEIDWIRAYGTSPEAQAQNGARFDSSAHVHRLNQWLALAPAVLPSPENCYPSLSHPDLTLSNILVSGEDSELHISGIIDWQGATVHPFFHTNVPKFLGVEPEGIERLRPAPHLASSVELEDVDSLTNVSSEGSHQAALARSVITTLWDLSPMFANSLGSAHFERLRKMTYISSHSWSDGLPLVVLCLMNLCDNFGAENPINPRFPNCPISFSEEEMEQQRKNLKIHHREHLLENMMEFLMSRKELMCTEDGSVPAGDLEKARGIVTRGYEIAQEKLGSARLHELDPAWPYRENKFTLGSETCD